MAFRGDSTFYALEYSCTMQEQALTMRNTNFTFWTLHRNDFVEVFKMVVINILYSKSNIIIKYTNDIMGNDNKNWKKIKKKHSILCLSSFFRTFKAYIVILYPQLSEFTVTMSESSE